MGYFWSKRRLYWRENRTIKEKIKESRGKEKESKWSHQVNSSNITFTSTHTLLVPLNIYSLTYNFFVFFLHYHQLHKIFKIFSTSYHHVKQNSRWRIFTVCSQNYLVELVLIFFYPSLVVCILAFIGEMCMIFSIKTIFHYTWLQHVTWWDTKDTYDTV